MQRRSFLSVLAALAIAPFVGIAKAAGHTLPKYPADEWPKRKITRINPDGSRTVVRMNQLKKGDKFQIDGDEACTLERVIVADWKVTNWIATGEPYRYGESGNWTIAALTEK